VNELHVKKILKTLVPIKIIMIVAVVAYLNHQLYFGEKVVDAVEAAAPPSEDAVKPGPEKLAKGKPANDSPQGEKPVEVKPGGKKVAGSGSTSENPVVKTPISPARKSFLEGVLNLPDITDTASKAEEIGKYLSLAERKKQQVEERLTLLESREGQLKRIEEVIDEKLARLEDERLFFSQTIQKEKLVQADRLETLVSLYAKMEPKKAGPVFESLDRDLVVALFNKMEKKTVTRILEAVTPPRSIDLTEYFGRIRSGKEYDILKEMNVSLRSAFNDCKGMPAEEVSSSNSDPIKAK
jgi:flagellar motility protein MotE (MotC chaperone)